MPDFKYIETPSSLSSSSSQAPLQGHPIRGFKSYADDVSSLVQADDSSVSVPIFNEPKDADYYLDTAVFKVEGTLYKVAKYHFLKSEDFFAAKFAGCKSEDDVICLHDVSQDDFRTFLKLLYPLSILSTNTFITEEWNVVLKLSTQWKMLDIRNLAIRQLNVAEIDPIDRIVLAQKYCIPQWLTSSLVQLICREDSLSTNEAEKLDLELALKICCLRDSSRFLPDVLDDTAWNSAISVVFQKELQLLALSAVDRVGHARKNGVLEFLRASYIDLVERPGPLSDDEAIKLGCETTARICRVREQRIAGNLSTMSSVNLVEDELQAELSTATSVSAIRRVAISRGKVDEWLRKSLVEVAQRRQFSNDDVESLGKETMIRLYRVREAVCGTHDEIRAARVGAKGYSGTEEASAANGIVPQAKFSEEAIGYDTDGKADPLVVWGGPVKPISESPAPVSPTSKPAWDALSEYESDERLSKGKPQNRGKRPGMRS
ncbi:hypothetical protein C0995_014836 [Termitomyces sp. Mi166|nr:hypothetical protein C0995_014836 [Termitomyces sp. Mi166\